MKIKNVRLKYMRKKRSKKSDVGIYGKTNSKYFIDYFSNFPPMKESQILEIMGYSPWLARVVLSWSVGTGVLIKSYLGTDHKFAYLQGANFGVEEWDQKKFSKKSKNHVIARRNLFLEMNLDKMPPRKSYLKMSEYARIESETKNIQVYPALDYIMEKLKQNTDMKNYLFNLAEKQGLIICDIQTGKWHGAAYEL